MLNRNGDFPAPVTSQRGLTLIEVMVALLVLSIGLVGIAAMNLFAVRAVHSSLQSSTASIIALDSEEWLWEALGDNRLGSCLQLEQVIASMESHWFPEETVENRITLPAGQIEVSDCRLEAIGNDCVIEATLAVSWAEGRFDDSGSNENRELFKYKVGVPCKI